MSGHTATPWDKPRLSKVDDDLWVVPEGSNWDLFTIRISHASSPAVAEANAAFIVTAYNSHAELTEALKGATVSANIAGSLLKEKDAKIEALSDSHAELVKALGIARDWMMVDIEYGDEEQFNIDLALVDAALATLTARKMG